MKKYLRPLGLILVLGLLAGGAYAASSEDSLISRSYLQSTFFPKAVQAGEEKANQALQEVYDRAKGQLDALHGGGVLSGSYSETLQRRQWTDGQAITLSTGSGVLMLEGYASLAHNGAVVDVTTGAEVPSGGRPPLPGGGGHRRHRDRPLGASRPGGPGQLCPVRREGQAHPLL